MEIRYSRGIMADLRSGSISRTELAKISRLGLGGNWGEVDRWQKMENSLATRTRRGCTFSRYTANNGKALFFIHRFGAKPADDSGLFLYVTEY